MSKVIWVTGLSAAGKTTLARVLQAELQQRGLSAILLDGDDLRFALGATSSRFDREGRKQNAFTFARFCKILSEQGFVVICATISLFHDVHRWNRENLPGYCEIFLDVPLEELERRDRKGLYTNYQSGSIHNVAGLDLAVEFPLNPDLRIKPLPGESPEHHAELVMLHLGIER